MNNIVIFDLDDTLANTTQRQWVFDEKHDSPSILKTGLKRFTYMESLCPFDEPIQKNIELYKQHVENKDTVLIWSGRSELFRKESIGWLSVHTGYPAHFFTEENLLMRPINDYSKSTELKMRWWRKLSKEEQARVSILYDDNVENVNMWKSIGKNAVLVTKDK